jgi:hypothetical protein
MMQLGNRMDIGDKYGVEDNRLDTPRSMSGYLSPAQEIIARLTGKSSYHVRQGQSDRSSRRTGKPSTGRRVTG